MSKNDMGSSIDDFLKGARDQQVSYAGRLRRAERGRILASRIRDVHRERLASS